MFRQNGSAHDGRNNRILAGYLAFVGGFVNSVGFLLIGTFTSHVTGNVGRAANDLAQGQLGAGLAALTMTVAFCGGAFVTSVVVESGFFGHSSRAYAVALGIEALLLVSFATCAAVTVDAHPRIQDAEAALLCAAMGMQNSLVTRMSGAVVRTTHLTGVFTDIGIEGARWFRYFRSKTAEHVGVRLVVGQNTAERPHFPKIALLVTIAFGFASGAVVGALSVVRWHHAAMFFAAAAVVACAIFALVNGARRKDDVRDSRR